MQGSPLIWAHVFGVSNQLHKDICSRHRQRIHHICSLTDYAQAFLDKNPKKNTLFFHLDTVFASSV